MPAAWIKIAINLTENPKVRLAAKLCKCNALTVTGALVWLWSRANEHTTDGRLVGYDAKTIDAAVGIAGFAAALADERIEWLTIDVDWIQIPEFSRHNGDSAKQRLATADRVQRHRLKRKCNAECNGHSVTQSSLKPLPEEEEEEEEKGSTPLPPSKKNDPEPTIPASIDTPAFRTAWAEWLAYRKLRRLTVGPPTIQKQLAALAAAGPEAAIAAIENSIKNGWSGIFPEATNGHTKGNVRAMDSGLVREAKHKAREWRPQAKTDVARGSEDDAA